MTRPPVDPKRTLTLRDVSEASGVSEMTVSRVLRNRGDVSDATREKVLEAAKMLGYVPNKIAGALASQRVNLVAVIIPSLSNLVFPEVLAGISAGLEDTGLQPVVGVTNYSQEKEESVLYEMLSWRPSGVIIAGLEHTDAARAMMENAGIPIVEIMDVDGAGVDSVVAQITFLTVLALLDSSTSFSVHIASPPKYLTLARPSCSIWRNIGPAWASRPP